VPCETPPVNEHGAGGREVGGKRYRDAVSGHAASIDPRRTSSP
jgi:hypothetical protein